MARKIIQQARDWRLRRGVRLQLTAWYGLALVVLLVVLGLFVYWVLSTNLRGDTENQLALRATQIASTLDVEDGTINFGDSQPSGDLVLVYNSKGELIESNSSLYRPVSLPTWASPQNGPAAYATVTLSGEPWLMYATAIEPGEHSQGVGRLLIGRSLEPIDEMLNQTLLALALAGPLLIVLACAGGYFLAGRALAPVAAITRTARRIQAEGLGSRIGLGERHDELGELAATLDEMFGRLEETFARERRFTADAAHELRTPLAVVRAETSLALARPRRLEEYRRVIGVVEGEAERMGKLVGDLLTLARADEGKQSLESKLVSLAPLCHAVIAQMSPLAMSKGVELDAQIGAEPIVVGDGHWLSQMLTNLVDNGIKYTPTGGWVKVTLRMINGMALLGVEDNGIGIAKEQLPYIFDRFYRTDKARSRDAEATGFGLGLAICNWVVTAHGGHIQVESRVGQGTRFVVSLPATDAGTRVAGRAGTGSIMVR